MKSTLAILIVLFFFSNVTSVKAQKLKYGIVAGLNIAHISGYDHYSVNPQGTSVGSYGKPGFQIGGLTAYSFGEFAQLSLDLKYTQKGHYSKIYPNYNDSAIWKLKLNYIETNLILKVKMIKMVSVYGGCGYGVLVKKETEALSGKLPDTFYEMPYSRGDFSISWGLSARIVQGLNLNLGLQISMASIVNGEVDNITYSSQYGDIGIYSELVMVTLDYRFGGRREYSSVAHKNVRYL